MTAGGPTIRRFAVSADPAEMFDGLAEDGVIIIQDCAATRVIDAVHDELRPHLEAASPGGGVFFGHRSKRVQGVAARSPTFTSRLLLEPSILALADRVLLDNCATYQLQLASALEVWPGGELQPLHRDDGTYAPYLRRHLPNAEILFSQMWAISDFTRENGATRVAPGSHRWSEDRTAEEGEIAYAEMTKGSVLLWLGSVIHGMGVNTTTSPRTGLVSGFSLGWLRQEENQYLATPPEVARRLPEQAQRLLGYNRHCAVLGWVYGQDPYDWINVTDAPLDRQS